MIDGIGLSCVPGIQPVVRSALTGSVQQLEKLSSFATCQGHFPFVTGLFGEPELGQLGCTFSQKDSLPDGIGSSCKIDAVWMMKARVVESLRIAKFPVFRARSFHRSVSWLHPDQEVRAHHLASLPITAVLGHVFLT